MRRHPIDLAGLLFGLAFAIEVFTAGLPRRFEHPLALVFAWAQLVEHIARLALRHSTPQDWLQNVGAIVFAVFLVVLSTVESLESR